MIFSIECECDSEGAVDNNCHKETGTCECKSNVGGDDCSSCIAKHYGFPACHCKFSFVFFSRPALNYFLSKACDCDSEGARSQNCDAILGHCDCIDNVVGDSCDTCEHAYYGFPTCRPCNCDSTGSKAETCEHGVCDCISRSVTGDKCDQCVEGHYNFPYCDPCKCSDEGSLDSVCNVMSGDCDCIENVTGRRCDECA